MKQKESMREVLFEYILPIFTGFMYAVSIKYFIRPSAVIMTGTEGISIATSYYLNSELAFVIMYSIFQLILITFSFFKIGAAFSIKTLLTVSSVSCFILVLPAFSFGSPEYGNERLVLVIFGAIIAGIAKSLSLKNRGSVGDEDIIAVYISEKLRKPVGKTIIFAGAISMTYGLILAYIKSGNLSAVANTLIYTTIFIFITAETVNSIYKRYKYSLVTINTDNLELVSNAINTAFPEKSFTVSHVLGGFTNSERTQITLVLSQEELPDLLEIIKNLEGKCFLFYSSIDGVIGRFPLRKF